MMERQLQPCMPGRFVFRRCIVKRETSSLATLVFLLMSLPLMVAQDPQSQPGPAALTLMGTIVKDGTRYVLKVSSNSAYQLDDQDAVKQFEGKQVRIAGSLDADGKVLHITSIELVS